MEQGNSLEARIAAIWGEVLGSSITSYETSFFDLGGSSLKMMRVHAAIRDVLGSDIPIIDLFAHPTVAGLARHLLSPIATEAASHQPRVPGRTGGDAIHNDKPAPGIRRMFRPYKRPGTVDS